MKSYILYGSSKLELTVLLSKIESVLSVKFEAHESAYHGGVYYRLNDIGEEHFILQNNLELDNELAESRFPEHKVLFYVNETRRPEEINQLLLTKIPDIVLLRREDIRDTRNIEE